MSTSTNCTSGKATRAGTNSPCSRRSAASSAYSRAGRPNKAATPATAPGSASCIPSPSCPPEDQRRVADLVAAVAAAQRDLGVLALPVGAVDALKLPRAFDDLQHALDMGLGKLAPGGVGRQRAAHAQ